MKRSQMLDKIKDVLWTYQLSRDDIKESAEEILAEIEKLGMQPPPRWAVETCSRCEDVTGVAEYVWEPEND